MDENSTEINTEKFKALYSKFSKITRVNNMLQGACDHFLKDTSFNIDLTKVTMLNLSNVLARYGNNIKELKEIDKEDDVIKNKLFLGKFELLGASFYKNAKESVYFNLFESLIFAYNTNINRWNESPNIPSQRPQPENPIILQDSIQSFEREMDEYNTVGRAKHYWESIKKHYNKNVEIKEELANLYSEKGITSFSKTYNNIATEENTAKNWWLFLTAFSTAIAVLLTMSSLFCIFFTENPTNMLERFPWTMVFVLVALWTSHRYSAARRNHLIYRHLAATLTTFKTFEESVSEEQKSLLLFEIAKVLFPPPIDKRTENQKELGNMIDLVKTFNQQGIFNSKSKGDE